MKVEKTFLDGLLVIQPDVFNDDRGFFFESYSQKKYDEFLDDNKFVQDNFSRSAKGTVRGLHYQAGKAAQAKLCSVLEGKVLDIAVDVRFGSPTYGKYFSIELSDENHTQLFIPEGFAHGFAVLSNSALFHYKCSSYYSKEDERSIYYADKDLNIDWQVEEPIVSKKDLDGKKFLEIEKDFIYKINLEEE